MRPTSPHLNDLAIDRALKRLTPCLVPTTYSSAFRDTGRYDSSERLPDLDLLLERTLRQIEHSHQSRQRSKSSFDTLWNKVCKKLREKKNAASYAHWKASEDLIKNRKEIQELDDKLGDAWFGVESLHGKGDQVRVAYSHSDEFDALQQKRAKLAPKIRSTTDDALEIAIAYWIEAKNARNAGDDARVLHALIECHLYIGITLSAKTESESKSDSGKKKGIKERDAIAVVVSEVLKVMKIDKRIGGPKFLFGHVVKLIESDPQHGAVLEDYAEKATAGKKVEEGGSTADRFAETLRKWATDSKSPYPEIAKQYRHICDQLQRLNPQA